ncbi:MAG: MFS transporter [Fluviicola sp.]|nr:MFS transporter [Fluviicola sp.]
MMSFNLILPELNEYITCMGGENNKGLIIFLFSVSALISRPFSGKLSDTIGRKKVMYIGIIISVLALLVYPLANVVTYFLTLRFLHGFGAGFLPTGATAMVTDVLPENKRGVGMGVWGVFISLGFGTGQIIASTIRAEIGLNGLFFVAAGFAVFAAILISFVKETLPNPVKFKWSLLKVNWQDVFEPTVIPPAIVMFLSVSSSGIIFVLTQDMATYFGIDNKGWFFGFYVLSTIVVRLFSGKLSDTIGRRKTLIFGMSIALISIILLAFSTEWIQFTVAAIVFGIATGITSPTLFAWTADLSPSHRRGVGAGTLFIALEIGIMLGSASTMLTYDNSLASIPLVFSVGVVLMLLNISYLFWHLFYRESKT